MLQERLQQDSQGSYSPLPGSLRDLRVAQASQGEGRGDACRKSLRRPRDASGFAFRWRPSPCGGSSQLWVLMKRLAVRDPGGAGRNAFPVIAHPLYFHNGFIHFFLRTYGILHGCNVPMKTAAGMRRLDGKPKLYFKSIVSGSLLSELNIQLPEYRIQNTDGDNSVSMAPCVGSEG